MIPDFFAQTNEENITIGLLGMLPEDENSFHLDSLSKDSDSGAETR